MSFQKKYKDSNKNLVWLTMHFLIKKFQNHDRQDRYLLWSLKSSAFNGGNFTAFFSGSDSNSGITGLEPGTVKSSFEEGALQAAITVTR